jgi:predicted 2-oxoglutarate/Fe(II)-dependent dioxygenase YbiX
MRVLKYEKAGFLPGHTDQGVSTRCVSVLIYLNDDYEGGNIVFPNSKVSLKPEAGSMLFFPSNFLYVHEIEPILSGTKYSLPNWYHNVTKEKRYFSTGEA